MWFSIGHSSVVVALIIALIFATKAITSNISALQSIGATIGTLVSGGFLWFLGLINVIIAFEICKILKTLRKSKLNQAELDSLLEKRGFLNRFFHRIFKIIKEPWHIYPIGVLFGLGFDTASDCFSERSERIRHYFDIYPPL